jgi:uracil-DNA glycosylase
MLKKFPLSKVHTSWRPIVKQALAAVKEDYLHYLLVNDEWLPGTDKIFNAFSLPKNKTRYILFGESPYPRETSANGYAFWDAAVKELWSPTGLSSTVNRATSLRNLIKMLLLARNDLQLANISQNAIAKLDKSIYVPTVDALFNNFLQKGFLLLNASLVFHTAELVKKCAKMWFNFIDSLLQQLQPSDIQLVLLGNIAKLIGKLKSAQVYSQFTAEHPYNLSFIANPQIQHFFRSFDLLSLK